MRTASIERYLNSFGQEVVKKSKAMLHKDKGDTVLGKSISFKVEPDPSGLSVKFYMLDYGTFLDKGVSGNKKKRSFTNYKGQSEPTSYSYTTKQPPPEILSRWIIRKGLKPKGLGRGRDKNTGRFISNLAYIIGRNIKAKGIPSLSFFQVPFGIEYKKLKKDLLKAFEQDVLTYITTFTKHK